ncbi:MAG: transporter substrate-binding domain-containing protein [Bacteroidales bacterium]|nr:transporter substrate-binding domain-containing protein [Bacteroidales bacterium]
MASDSKSYLQYICIFFILMLFVSCSGLPDEEEHEEIHGVEIEKKIEKSVHDTTNSYQMVIEHKKLVAVTNFNSLNYYIYRGETMGYQFEMLKAFADNMGVVLEIKVENDLAKSLEMLYEGKVDVIATGLIATTKRMRWFDFSDPLIITKQVLIQKLPKNWQQMRTLNEIESGLLRSTIELGKKEIHVKQGSAYQKRLTAISNDIGDTIYIIEDKREVEELIQAVASGEIKYTIADQYLAMANKQNYPELDFGMPVSFDQKIAWAFRKEGTNELRDEMNNWLRLFSRSAVSRNIYNKYFISTRMQRMMQRDYQTSTGGNISIYDHVIKDVAKEIGWDWRLLASLIYQESNFKADAENWSGAYGLMQLMPSVMLQFGIDSTTTPEMQIRVGGKYISYLDRLIPETVTDSIERAKFVLAAYNTGVGHVLDARRLAEKYNKNPNIWTDNVDFFSKNKSKPTFYNDPAAYYGYARGEETYDFIVDIFDRYENYKNLVNK